MAEVTPQDPGPTDGRPFVVLGVSAGIAAYKAVEVCRRLVDAGCHVAPVLTERATRFVGRATFDALGSEPTQTSVFDEVSPIPHTRLGQRADVVVVAPATADLLARYAAGLADDLLTTTLVATAAPVVVCPAMHTEMWEHPSVQDNLGVLAGRGVTVVPPEEGRLAGGDVGSGRMAEPGTIVAAVLEPARFAGRVGPARPGGVRVLVSAGGTREAIDPVRFITNRSSGKQGHAVAAAARRRGRLGGAGDHQLPAPAAGGRGRGGRDRGPDAGGHAGPGGRCRRGRDGRRGGRLPAQGGRGHRSCTSRTASPSWCSSRPTTSWPNWAVGGSRARCWSGSRRRPTTCPSAPGPSWWPRAST